MAWRGFADYRMRDGKGLEVVARIDIVPEWARPIRTSDRQLEPEHYQDFARYVAAFATRYRGSVRYIQIWNEPNLYFEWGGREPDPVAYAALLRAVVPAVKAADAQTCRSSRGTFRLGLRFREYVWTI